MTASRLRVDTSRVGALAHGVYGAGALIGADATPGAP
jgi:hypothetical protein